MYSRSFFLSIALSVGLYPLLAQTTHPITPGTRVAITSSSDILSFVSVSGTDAGYLITCINNSDNLVSSFSANGVSWSSPLLTYVDAYTGPFVSGTAAGFMASYIGIPIGYTTAQPYSIFSSDDGGMWGSETLIETSSTVATPIAVSGTSAGFMTSWLDTSDHNAYSSFSSDNGGTWSTPVQITSSGLLYSTYPYNGVIVNGTSAGFLTAWQQTDQNAYSSFSSDNGSSWSGAVPITTTGDVASDVWVSSNSSGFMASWLNSSNSAYSSFSSDNGTSWSTPVEIGTNVLSVTDVSVSGGTIGFVASWIGQDNNAYGSFSSDNGSTWSTPVQITSDGSLSTSYSYGNGRGFIGISLLGNHCLFTWQDNGQNAQSNLATLTGSITPPTNLTGNQIKNDFGLQYELCNVIRWEPSLSAGVAGYYVYRNGIKIATLGPSVFNYEDHDQKRGVAESYSVTSFNEENEESAGANITI